MKRNAITERNVSVTTKGERVVVAGGTQGIGAGIACRFAQAGAEVWIIGRNEAKAQATLAQLNELSQEKKIDPPPAHRFIKADLSLISEVSRTAQDIRTRAGPRGVDYLVMTQGGPPNGSYVPTSEGIEQHYAVQVLSRLVLTYKLAVESDPVVTKGVMSIMAPSQRRSGIDYNDLDLQKANEKGAYGIMKCVWRDSVFIDVVAEEFARRVPSIAFTHLYPGTVKTDSASNSGMPWYFAAFANAYLAILGDTISSYAEVPFYLLANPEGRSATFRAHFWDQNSEKTTANPTPQDKNIREKIWNELMERIKAHASA